MSKLDLLAVCPICGKPRGEYGDPQGHDPRLCLSDEHARAEVAPPVPTEEE